jgi:hypothetical protein
MRAANSQRFARAAAEGILVAKRQRAAAASRFCDFAAKGNLYPLPANKRQSHQILFFQFFWGTFASFCIFWKNDSIPAITIVLHFQVCRFDQSLKVFED